MVALGRANGRMKDFYDLRLLFQTHAFETARLAGAIAATFERRKTDLPEEVPDALSDDFSKDRAKQEQWSVFVRGIEQDGPTLENVVSELRAKLMPLAEAARTDH